MYDPIKYYAAKDLRIVLSACSTLCGTDESTNKRLTTLLKYFRASEGSLFGAYAKTINDSDSSLKPTKSETSLYGTVYYPFYHSFYTFVIYYWGGIDTTHTMRALVQMYGVPALMTLATYSALKLGLANLLTAVSSKYTKINRGYLYYLTNSKISKKVPASLYYDHDLIVGPGCKEALSLVGRPQK